MNLRVLYDALDRTTGEHIQGSGALVDIAPDESTEDGRATFYVFRDGEDGDEVEPIALRGRLTAHRVLDDLAREDENEDDGEDSADWPPEGGQP